MLSKYWNWDSKPESEAHILNPFISVKKRILPVK